MIIDELKSVAEQNENFRQVLFTGKNTQLVVMSLSVGEEIGSEIHPDIDQVLMIVDGKVEAILDDARHVVGGDGMIIVPAGVRHNIKNVGDTPVKLWTCYSPPEHPDGTVHKTKADAAEHE